MHTECGRALESTKVHDLDASEIPMHCIVALCPRARSRMVDRRLRHRASVRRRSRRVQPGREAPGLLCSPERIDHAGASTEGSANDARGRCPAQASVERSRAADRVLIGCRAREPGIGDKPSRRSGGPRRMAHTGRGDACRRAARGMGDLSGGVPRDTRGWVLDEAAAAMSRRDGIETLFRSIRTPAAIAWSLHGGSREADTMARRASP
ncbi:hypothetical protein BIM11_6101 [Burkholderia pseudomallei]|nr:hypothetical protein X977_5805 [Burkholderia pseudomallei MSHR7504]KGX48064.1 hypothetical protein Y043_6267 [Burkholderia pseudomallei MSHR2138]OAG65204.1 hypothetical protein BIM11_6101 [Burkholderia pseudomallei]